MKKIIILCIIFLSSFSFINAKADTLYRTGDKNGEVKLSLNTSQGYVGALDMHVTLNGNISFQKLTWDDSLPSSYIKKYTPLLNKEAYILNVTIWFLHKLRRTRC